MSVLPRYYEAVVPIEKFTEYCLNPEKDCDKATAFDDALGYNRGNARLLISEIIANLPKFPARMKEDLGYGQGYEVIMRLRGPNGKFAKVLTGWIDHCGSGEMRLTTAHVDS